MLVSEIVFEYICEAKSMRGWTIVLKTLMHWVLFNPMFWCAAILRRLFACELFVCVSDARLL